MTSLPSNSVALKAIDNVRSCLTEHDNKILNQVDDLVKEGKLGEAMELLEDYAERESKSLANLSCLSGVLAYSIIEYGMQEEEEYMQEEEEEE